MEELSYKPILVAVLALVGLGAFLVSPDRARNGFLLFIVCLGLGYRTIGPTHALRFHPAEFALLVAFLFSGAGTVRTGRNPRPKEGGWDGPPAVAALPRWLWILLPFMALAWTMAGTNPQPWDDQLSECINIALAVPVFLTTRAVLARREHWRPVLVVAYATGSVVAFVGVLEYYVPGLKSALPGFVTVSGGITTEDGFNRALFSFYGGPHAVFLCMQVLPLGLALWQWWPQSVPRLAIGAAALIQVWAVYISGWRSQWFALALFVVLFALKKRSFVLVGVFVVLAVLAQAGLELAPKEGRGRLETLAKILEGQPADSSARTRFGRIEDTFWAVLDNPLGSGWASSGWTHSDFLQIAHNLGLLPGLVFLFGSLHMLYRLAVRVRAPDLSGELAAAGFPLLLAFLAVIGLLALQPMEGLVFCILPVWLTWALAHCWLSQTAPAPTAGTRPARKRPNGTRQAVLPGSPRVRHPDASVGGGRPRLA